VSIRTRLAKLETAAGVADGRCPACGFRPQDIRTIVVCRPTACDGTEKTDGTRGTRRPPGPGWKPAATWPSCPLCGGPLPPIPIMEEAADGSLWFREDDGFGRRGDAQERPETSGKLWTVKESP
jgi:hypothetical protein